MRLRQLQQQTKYWFAGFFAGSGLGNLVRRLGLAGVIFLAVMPSQAQEALRNLLTGDAASEARRLQQESQPYNFKSGNFRLLVVPSLSLDWNDNINVSRTSPEDEFILHSMLQLNSSYPITDRNLLDLNIGFGYDNYFHHPDRSTWRVQSGSELSFDIFLKDIRINLHDRFSHAQDSAQQSAVAGTAEFGTINNTAGLLGTWNLSDITMSLGYDHANVMSSSSGFQSQDHASEMFVGRLGFRVHPQVTAGLEATAAFTAYDKLILNDNSAYSLGVYADWHPGPALNIKPRAGYTIYSFQKTSLTNRTSDLNSWYVDLSATHDLTETLNYSFSLGHEVRLGIQSDANEVWYFRPSLGWRVIKNLNLQTSLFYEHGKQGAGNVVGNLTEMYDWYGGGINLGRPLTKRLHLGLNYRLTLRSSNDAARGYSQNLVSLLLTYQLP